MAIAAGVSHVTLDRAVLAECFCCAAEQISPTKFPVASIVKSRRWSALIPDGKTFSEIAEIESLPESGKKATPNDG